MISPGYAAPEQYGGKELTYQTDIYSVGMVLKFMADSNTNTLPDTFSLPDTYVLFNAILLVLFIAFLLINFIF